MWTHGVHPELLQNLGRGVLRGALLTSRGPRPLRSAEPAAVGGTRVVSRSLVGSPGWTAAGGTRTAPIATQTAERRLCGVRGALRVASSPACPPSLLWRHPAPGPDSALRCRPLHSRAPCSRILHSSDLRSHPRAVRESPHPPAAPRTVLREHGVG